MRKIAILYPSFLSGGAEFVAAWMMEFLKENYDLTLFTYSEIDFAQIDHQFGTNLVKCEIKILPQTKSHNLIQNSQSYSFFTIRQHLLSREFRKHAPGYDLAISAFNEMDLGKPGIQYIHLPLFGHGNEKARKILGYPVSPLRTFYQRSCEVLAGYSNRRMKENLTLTNSAWTASLIKHSLGIRSEVLYPPVILDPPEVQWEERENGFVCSGRLTTDKKIESIIAILEDVRSHGHKIHLHIVGSGSDPEYYQKILKLIAENHEWVFIDGGLSRTELAEMLAKHKYGIHGRAKETFGIAIAEMIKAGCIPFIPNHGGPEEVVGEIPVLKFLNADDAVENICSVLNSSTLQTDLQNQLALRKNLFSPEKFRAGLIALVEQALNKK